MVKLQQMSELVTQADQLTKREVRFIEGYPLSSLMETDAFDLLKEAEVLMSSLVSYIVTGYSIELNTSKVGVGFWYQSSP